MNRILRSLAVTLIALGGFANAQAATLQFDFSSVAGAMFRFDGNGVWPNIMDFTNGAGGVDFQVTLQNANWPGTVVNYTGDIIGEWLVSHLGNPAPVSGTGSLVLRNAANTATLTSDLSWSNIGTLGVGGVLNVYGAMNLTNMSLVGADPNLAALQAAGAATVTVTFQGMTIGVQDPDEFLGAIVVFENCSAALIDQLRCGGISTSSYSGTLLAESQVVPIPAAAWMLVGGLGALGALRRRQLAA